MEQAKFRPRDINVAVITERSLCEICPRLSCQRVCQLLNMIPHWQVGWQVAKFARKFKRKRNKLQSTWLLAVLRANIHPLWNCIFQFNLVSFKHVFFIRSLPRVRSHSVTLLGGAFLSEWISPAGHRRSGPQSLENSPLNNPSASQVALRREIQMLHWQKDWKPLHRINCEPFQRKTIIYLISVVFFTRQNVVFSQVSPERHFIAWIQNYDWIPS